MYAVVDTPSERHRLVKEVFLEQCLSHHKKIIKFKSFIVKWKWVSFIDLIVRIWTLFSWNGLVPAFIPVKRLWLYSAGVMIWNRCWQWRIYKIFWRISKQKNDEMGLFTNYCIFSERSVWIFLRFRLFGFENKCLILLIWLKKASNSLIEFISNLETICFHRFINFDPDIVPTWSDDYNTEAELEALLRRFNNLSKIPNTFISAHWEKIFSN